eukprot:1330465-Amorphochlora_amoeboformis.AAC.1
MTGGDGGSYWSRIEFRVLVAILLGAEFLILEKFGVIFEAVGLGKQPRANLRGGSILPPLRRRSKRRQPRSSAMPSSAWGSLADESIETATIFEDGNHRSRGFTGLDNSGAEGSEAESTDIWKTMLNATRRELARKRRVSRRGKSVTVEDKSTGNNEKLPRPRRFYTGHLEGVGGVLGGGTSPLVIDDGFRAGSAAAATVSERSHSRAGAESIMLSLMGRGGSVSPPVDLDGSLPNSTSIIASPRHIHVPLPPPPVVAESGGNSGAGSGTVSMATKGDPGPVGLGLNKEERDDLYGDLELEEDPMRMRMEFNNVLTWRDIGFDVEPSGSDGRLM